MLQQVEAPVLELLVGEAELRLQELLAEDALVERERDVERALHGLLDLRQGRVVEAALRQRLVVDARRAGQRLAADDVGEDVVDLAKELDRLAGVKDYEGFECRGGALDGARLESGDVKKVAKWPTRMEQLSLLSGQISSLASTLSGQILSAGGGLAGQIASRVEDLEKAGGDPPAA